MTLWQTICTYGLAVLHSLSATVNPLLDQLPLDSPSTSLINSELPSIELHEVPHIEVPDVEVKVHNVDVPKVDVQDINVPSIDIHNVYSDYSTNIQPLSWITFPINRTDRVFKTNNECNSPANRKRWCYQRSINTDYEDIELVPNTGITRHIILDLTNGEIFCGDGYCRRVMLINGTYPGPVIRGNWGDKFSITVRNNMVEHTLPDGERIIANGTGIHWHGLRQFQSVWADGVPGVTQCPIPPGQNMTYHWRATQYGTSWYHSHFSLQYADGLAGPLIIDGPTTTEYDEDKGPLTLTDWYHGSSFSLYHLETAQNGTGPPKPDSYLINGIGAYSQSTPDNSSLVCQAPDTNDGTKVGCYSKIFENGMHIYGTYVEHEKKYKYRIINTSATTHFSFWIEHHEIIIVATDFVPIEPYKVSHVNVAIGQRYDIIVEAKTRTDIDENFKSPNFWIKMRPCKATCVGDPCISTGKNGKPNCLYKECRQGVLSYNLTSSISADLNWAEAIVPSHRCHDPPRENIKPWVRRDLRGHISPNLRFKSPFQVEVRNGTQVPPAPGDNSTEVNLWNIRYNDGEYSFMIDWARPTFKLVHEDKPIDARYVPIEIEGQDSEWTVFAIVSNWTSYDPWDTGHDEDGKPKPRHAIPGAAHPIHLHGHDFVVLAQVEGAGARNASFTLDQIHTFDLFNPPRRDVVMLPEDGYVIIAFRVDNPGVWLMHCHIAWHASAGLALQWIERRQEIPKLLKEKQTRGVMKQLNSQCKDWSTFYSKSKEKQDDSGV